MYRYEWKVSGEGSESVVVEPTKGIILPSESQVYTLVHVIVNTRCLSFSPDSRVDVFSTASSPSGSESSSLYNQHQHHHCHRGRGRQTLSEEETTQGGTGPVWTRTTGRDTGI